MAHVSLCHASKAFFTAFNLARVSRVPWSAYHLQGKTGYFGVNSNGTGHSGEFF